MTKISKNKSAKKKIKSNSISDSVAVSEHFRDRFHDYFSNPAAKEISVLLNNRLKSVKPTVATYRQINSWDEYGLVDIDRAGGEWRKYSIMDALWINVIFELRSFGYTIDLLRIVKKSLEEGNKKVSSKMPLLEFCTYWALGEKAHTFLLVFADGSSIPMSFNEYNLNIISGQLKNHIRIDINEILSRIIENNKDIKPVYDVVFLFPEKIKSKK